MKNFLIITNEQRDADLLVTNSITDYISLKGGTSKSFVSNKSNWSSLYQTADLLETSAECVIVIGGDGTLVRCARALSKKQIPVIGVNLGTLGYLCELEKENLFEAIDRIFEDNYEIEQRMMIKGYKPGETQVVRAQNDIVIFRSGRLQVINLIVRVDGEYLTTYTADGIIIATPTGSTGYSMSAGGPIVDPKTRMVVLTPINAHDLHSRSIMLDDDAVIEIELAPRRPELDEMVDVTFDGDVFRTMKVGERFVIESANTPVKILKLNKMSFLQILRKKMNHE